MHTDPTSAVTPSIDDYMVSEGKPLPRQFWPNVDHLITEDDTPVDNLFSAKQQRLLVDSLYSSGAEIIQRPFLADANVGVFYAVQQDALVPDVFVSLDVQPHTGWWDTYERSYCVWDYGKPPDVVIEIVSNARGREADWKLDRYARMHVLYYVIFDPGQHIGDEVLRVYILHRNAYQRWESGWLPEVGVGVTLWTGRFEDREATWLRWCTQDGQLLLTGAERAAQAEEREAQERAARAQAEERAERLAARLRALGIDPEAE